MKKLVIFGIFGLLFSGCIVVTQPVYTDYNEQYEYNRPVRYRYYRYRTPIPVVPYTPYVRECVYDRGRVYNGSRVRYRAQKCYNNCNRKPARVRHR